MAKKPLTIEQKIFRIAKLASQVPRNGIDPETGRTYARMEDVLDVVRPMMVRYKLVLWPNACTDNAQHSNGTITICMLWKIFDLENGTSQLFPVPGSGLHNEGHGTAIALSQSRKSALVLIFQLRVADEILVCKEDAQKHADQIGDTKVAAAEKRKATNAAKEFVAVTFPEEHNGHKALFKGRICIMEHKAFKYMNQVGTWSEREEGWFVPRAAVQGVIDTLINEKGCSVHEEFKK